MKPRWQIDAGNSTVGPIGFVLHRVAATTPAAALAIAKAELPEHVHAGGGLHIYINVEALTIDDVAPDEWDD